MSNQKKFTQRMAAAAGTMAGVAAMPATAEAGVVSVTGAPVSLSLSAANGTSVTWDIDGDSVSDFRLWKQSNTFNNPTYGYFGRNASVFLASNTEFGGQGNGRGLVAPYNTDNVQALAGSFVVGPTVTPFSWGFANGGTYAFRNAMSNATFNGNPIAPNIGYDFVYNGFAPGSNFFGFRFDDGIGGGLNYGYGVIDFDLTSGTVTISEWHYETDDDVGVHVGVQAVPEPNSLALLAVGAAGVAAYRRRRTAKAAPESTDAEAEAVS